MRGAFDDDIEERKSSIDAEITLGAGTMLLLSAGFVVVCGFCFGMGYLVGHRGAVPLAAAQQTDSAPASSQASNSQQKPSATAQVAVSAPAQPVEQSDNVPPAVANDPSQSSAVAVPVLPTQAPKAAPAPPGVRAALPAAPEPKVMYTSRLAPTQALPQASPAPTPATAAMWVQIAAVSHVEDAQVLTTALRKRGYTVTPRREADNLIHVRVGPFTTSDEASRWRAKLLDDGYNAEVQK